MHWTHTAHEDLTSILLRFGSAKRQRLLADLAEIENLIATDPSAGSAELFADLAASEEFASQGRIVTFGHNSSVVVCLAFTLIGASPTVFGCFLADDLLSALDP